MEYNKLIAEFMGLSIKEGVSYYTDQDDMFFLGEVVLGPYLPFDEDWNWLMAVLEKIECTTIDNNDNSDNFFNVMIEVFECNINGGNICICQSGNTKLEAAYKAVVEFIKQLNKES